MTDDLGAFARRMSDFAEKFDQRVELILRKSALDVEAIAKQLAPVDTGNLRASIGTSDVRATAGGGLEIEIGPTASYALFLEVGTSRMGPRPYMGPALDRVEPAFHEAFTQLADDLPR